MSKTTTKEKLQQIALDLSKLDETELLATIEFATDLYDDKFANNIYIGATEWQRGINSISKYIQSRLGYLLYRSYITNVQNNLTDGKVGN